MASSLAASPLLLLLLVVALACMLPCSSAVPTFSITHTSNASITGRVYLIVSTDLTQEPRTLVSDLQDTQQIFGLDVAGLAAQQPAVIDASVLGFPRASTADIPLPARYALQAVVQPYDYYQRGDGHALWLPRVVVNRVGGLLSAPGTLYSTPVVVTLQADSHVALTADQLQPEVPSVGPANDTEYIKHVRVYSARLSQFWGRDVYLEACVLLPWGWADHPEARYPMVVYQGHYSEDWASPVAFSTAPPAANLTGLAYVQALYAFYLYRNWTAPAGLFHGSRVLVATIKHPNPFFDDSYSVNSANVGPYGDAIHLDLVPELERQFRGIGEPWARVTLGGSTGGWEALAAQVLYPDSYNGAWVFCPDNIDFRAYTTVNLYNDSNAYYYDAPWKRTARPGMRDMASNFNYPIEFLPPFGQTTATIEELCLHELVMGEKTRSTGQFDIWEAVFAPIDPQTGYPMRLWDKRTGAMNREAIEYAREHYDLTYIMQRDWATLGPKLQGKLSIYVGGSDTWFLNNAVMLAQDFLESTTDPYYNGTVVIGNHNGRGFAHCWTGDESEPNAIARMTLNQRYVPVMVARMLATAPPEADVTSWRY